MAPDDARERTHRPRDSGTAMRRDAKGPAAEMWAGFRRFLRDDRPSVAIPRDVGLVAFFLVVLLGGMWAYTGQSFPGNSPIVVVESGSMMHPDVPYGRVGTIDPGDLILVKAAAAPDDIETAYGSGERNGYGGKGDVIVFRPYGRESATPIIHRALTWVEVRAVNTSDGETERRYTYYDESGVLRQDQPSVTLSSVGIRDRQFEHSGYVTKGDNPRTNAVADQIGIVRGNLVHPDWVVGKARGEIPWLGLVKLAMSGNPVPNDADGWCPFLRAWSPCDTWVMLGVSFVALVATPVVLEQVYRRSRSMRRWLE